MKNINLILPRTGILARDLLSAIGAGIVLTCPIEVWSKFYFPFQAALHEQYLGAVLLIMTVFYLWMGSQRYLTRYGFYVGVIDGILGIIIVAFRASQSQSMPVFALLSIIITAVITIALIYGIIITPAVSKKQAQRLIAVTLSVYLFIAYGLYPLTYVVGWFQRGNLSLHNLPNAAPHETYTIEIDGMKHFVYYGDLHGHSNLSVDARLFGAKPAGEFYVYARDVAGLDFCALTDHDTPNGVSDDPNLWHYICRLADEFNEPGKFVTFKAFEWTSGEGHKEVLKYWFGGDRWNFRNDSSVWGHRNVLFPGVDVPEIPFSHSSASYDTPSEFLEQVQYYDAIAIPHHPLGGPVTPMKWHHFNPEVERLVEIYSQHGSSESADAPLMIYNPYITNDGSSKHSVKHALNKGYHFGLIGSTDTHTGWGGNNTTHPENSLPESMIEWVRKVFGGAPVKGGGLTAVFARELTRKGIWEALQNRRTFATTGERIVLVLEVANAFMGEVTHMHSAEEIEIEGRVVGTSPIEKISIIRNGTVLKEIMVRGETNHSFQLKDEPLPPGEYYYYLRVKQVDGEMAWSSPVWVKVEL
ncbi:MAG: DUF3604 domain-containing protein [Bacteroidota bacterium]